MSAPAFTSNYLAHKRKRLANSCFISPVSTRLAKYLKIAAIGEIIVDKLPFIPARVSFGPLVFRVLSGALCGASIFKVERKHTVNGAIVGGL